MPMTTSLLRRSVRLARGRDQRGYAALLVAILFPVTFVALAAVAVDTARWYVEVQRVQNAADAGSLAGVTYLPQDPARATSTAKDVTARNGYTDGSSGVSVAAAQGAKASQLKVTVTSTIRNTFGALIGLPATTISRSAISDFTGPAPMGSPCNTFGNEPSSGGGPSSVTPTGTALPSSNRFANCSSAPQFWATVEGPQTDKQYGDRYSTRNCSSSSVDGCLPPANSEYNQLGYFWVIKVASGAVNHPVTVQLYDPAYVYTERDCSQLPAASYLADDMNPYTRLDGKRRYGQGLNTSSTGASFCTGDFRTSLTQPITTSFEVRGQTDTQDPMQGATLPGCTKQYVGRSTAPTVAALQSTAASTTYDDQLAQVFHNWTALCTFTPTRDGDYYLHVRTNVSAGGSSVANTNGAAQIVYTGNPAVSAATGNSTYGEGVNAFGVRAVTQSGYENLVSVSGFDRMPIFANATNAQSQLNLIRVLPGAAGQYVSFSFYDVGDVGSSQSSSGTVQVLPPADATGSVTTTPFPGQCRAIGGYAGSTSTLLNNCTAPITYGTNNGKVETMSIPIPSDYTCDVSSNGNCWYQVRVSLSGAVNDITTWDASIVGDPVRLVQ